MPSPHDPVQALPLAEPLYVEPDATLRVVATRLAVEGVGALLVDDPEAGLSIISERDVIDALAHGADADEVWAADVATQSLRVARPDEPIIEVALAMLDASIRHVVVVHGERAVGVVSIRDVLAPLARAARGA